MEEGEAMGEVEAWATADRWVDRARLTWLERTPIYAAVSVLVMVEYAVRWERIGYSMGADQ